MPAVLGWLFSGLAALFGGLAKKWASRLLGAAAVGGVAAVGWETGILPLMLKSVVLVAMDIVFILMDRLLAFFLYVLDGSGLTIPTVSSVMGAMPQYFIDVGTAIGLWKSMAFLLTLAIFKWIVGIFTLRIVFRK